MDIRSFLGSLFEEKEPFENVRYEETGAADLWRLVITVDPERAELGYGEQEVTLNLSYGREAGFVSFQILKSLPEELGRSRMLDAANALNVRRYRLSRAGIPDREPLAVLHSFDVTANTYIAGYFMAGLQRSLREDIEYFIVEAANDYQSLAAVPRASH